MRVTGSGTPALAALRREFDPPLRRSRCPAPLDWTIAVDRPRARLDVDAREQPEGRGDRSAGAARQDGRRGDRAQGRAPRRAPTRRDEDALTVTYGNVGRLLAHRKLGARRRRRRSRAAAARPRGAGERRRAARASGHLGARRAARAQPRRLARAGGGAASPGAGAAARDDLALAGIDLDVGALDALRAPVQRHQGRRAPRAGRLAAATCGRASSRAPRRGRRPPPARRTGASVARLTRLAAAGRRRACRRGRGAAEARDARSSAGGQSVAGDRPRGRRLFRPRPRPRPARVRRAAARHRVADRPADAGQRRRPRSTPTGQWRIGRPGPADEARRRARSSRTAGSSSRGSAIADARAERADEDHGQLAWAGAPNDFDYPTLSGEFRHRRRPGPVHQDRARASASCSACCRCRRCRGASRSTSRDVFSEGFAFDEITGNVRIARRRHDDRRPAGSSGPRRKVDISGDADLARRRSVCNVRVQPALSCRRLGRRGAAVPRQSAASARRWARARCSRRRCCRIRSSRCSATSTRVTGSWSDPGRHARMPRRESPGAAPRKCAARRRRHGAAR